MNIMLIFIIAISLSMDAFSLSLAYGTISLTRKEISLIAVIVGVFHFFMPIFGMIIGSGIIKVVHVSGDIIVFIVFALIGLEMIIDSVKSKKQVRNMKIYEMIAFGFAVSIDSFSVGIGLKNISNNFIICSVIFSVTSAFFTYFGLIIGDKLNSLVGRFAPILGGFTLILLGISYIV